MARVLLERLCKTYPPAGGVPEFAAVKGIDLEIRDGEFMVLVGPSGCGKSTTLRMIAGLEDVSSGSVSIDGVVVNNVPPKDRDIAMVFQNYALYPHMTVRENLGFGLKMRETPPAEIDRRVGEAASLLGLETLLDRRPKALSGGQRQRVALGRAIVRKPKVFLFDEPLSNLDAKMRAATRTEISKLRARLGATMVYVTHDQVEAMTMGDRICVMKDGRIMQVGAPLELYDHPANLFVAGFLGSPPMNLLRGTLQLAGERLEFAARDAAGLRLPLPAPAARLRARVGDEMVLGLRPEHVSPEGGGVAAEAAVELAEPMGAETLLYAKVGEQPIAARAPGSHRGRTGDRVRLFLDVARAHYFDPRDERAL